MRKLRRIAFAIIALLFLALIGGVILVRHVSNRALPDYNADMYIDGLAGEVLILRDKHAVPAIYAENESDLYRAVGYVMAQDRLWQMDLLRRATTGRLSEIFGEDLVDADHLYRSLRITDKSRMILENMDPLILTALEAFSDGVNQFIDANIGRLPPEFTILRYRPEKWEPLHSVNLIGYMAWDLNMGWTTEVILHKIRQQVDDERFRELIPDPELQKSHIFRSSSLPASEILSGIIEPSSDVARLGLAVFSGSNNWAVSGEKSYTGKPIFANDMHLGLFAPGIWYQMQHVIDGELNVTGVVLPGAPFIVAGHNERIAWGMTNVMLDDVDFYRETVNPENPSQYLFMGEWRDMEIRAEIIRTGRNSQVGREIRFTHRGPVISELKDVDDEVISMRWAGNEYSDETRSIYLLNRAGNWEEFRDALTTFRSVSQNINYADIDGNIGLQTAAGIPLRMGDGVSVLPGGDDRYDWQGMVPFEELPFSYNPPEGFVISANNRTVPDEYPHYISYWFDQSYRFDRIREMLTEKEKLSVGDFEKMLGDRKSVPAEKFLPAILKELNHLQQPTVNEQWAMQALADWDMEYHPDAPGPLIFEKLYNRFLSNLLLDDIGEDLFNEFLGSKVLVRGIMDRVWGTGESAWLGDRSFSDAVRLSFTETIRWLEENLGPYPDRWAWGDVHRLTVSHPMGGVGLLARIFRLNRGPWSPGGSWSTVGPYSYSYTNPFVINHGASHRHIYSAADWNGSLSVIPTGISGIPASDYYCDQTELYVNNRFRENLFSREQVEGAAVYRMRLIPRED